MVIVERIPAGLLALYGGGAGAEETTPPGSEVGYTGGGTTPDDLGGTTGVSVVTGQTVVETG